MSRTALWFLTIILVGGALAVWFVILPGRQSKLAREGQRAYGTVQMKDERPDGEGHVHNIVTIIFQDSQNKNHQISPEVYDTGVFDSLKAGQDIKNVYYLPSDPDHGSIPGAEGMTTPRAGAVNFLAWTAFLAGMVTGILAWRSPKPDKGPVMTRR